MVAVLEVRENQLGVPSPQQRLDDLLVGHERLRSHVLPRVSAVSLPVFLIHAGALHLLSSQQGREQNPMIYPLALIFGLTTAELYTRMFTDARIEDSIDRVKTALPMEVLTLRTKRAWQSASLAIAISGIATMYNDQNQINPGLAGFVIPMIAAIKFLYEHGKRKAQLAHCSPDDVMKADLNPFRITDHLGRRN